MFGAKWSKAISNQNDTLTRDDRLTKSGLVSVCRERVCAWMLGSLKTETKNEWLYQYHTRLYTLTVGPIYASSYTGSIL